MIRGVLVVDKPSGVTSQNVDGWVKRQLRGLEYPKNVKVGHAGTLDPFATGVMLIGIGDATKDLHYLSGANKEYTATIRLGFATDTDDLTGEKIVPSKSTDALTVTPLCHSEDEAMKSRIRRNPVDNREQSEHLLSEITDQQIYDVIGGFIGPQVQVPSTYSAKQVDGKRAYDMARAGEEFELKAVEITVFEFEVLGIHRGEYIDVDVRVVCSAGTYIRALARDIGETIGVGGHLIALRRTRVGEFSIDDTSITITENPLTEPQLREHLITYPLGTALTFGVFDGVHKGHQRLIESVVQAAKKRGQTSVVLIAEFDNLPDHKSPEKILTIEDRIRQIKNLGVNIVEVLKLDTDTMELSYIDFIKKLRADYNLKTLVLNEEQHFGKDRLGTASSVQQYAAKLADFEVQSIPTLPGFSSSNVRKLLQTGDVKAAANQLGRHYKVRGTVVHGDERGRKLGFPTANVAGYQTLLPSDGVYYGDLVVQKQTHSAIISIGVNPTFSKTHRTLEANVIGRDDLDIYDQTVQVIFKDHIRPMQKFAGADELIARLKYDTVLAQCAAAIEADELTVFPTDTVFGLAAKTPEKLYAVKARPANKKIAMLVADVSDVNSKLNDTFVELASKHWPGALTIILDDQAYRMPNHPIALDILKLTGPLYVTSANLSGQPPVTSAQVAKETFGDAVSIYVDGEVSPENLSSTVVQINPDTTLTTLRQGEVRL